MMRRTNGLLLISFVVLAVLLSGCMNTDGSDMGDRFLGSKISSNNSVDATDNSGDRSSYSDYSKGFPERIRLEIPVYERAYEGWNVSDNYYTRWIQKEFGDKYNIDIKFVPITKSGQVTDYYQLLASHKAPDIIFHYDMPQALAYYSEDVMQALDLNEIAYYAPSYWNKMESTIRKYGEVDNKQVFFFAARPDADNFATIIRQDWVEKVGMTMEDLTSLEKYNEMLIKWKKAGLGVGAESLKKNNFIFNYSFRDWPINETEHAIYSDIGVADLTTPATERYLRNINYQFNHGLIDREFHLRDDESKIKAEFVAGRTGIYDFYMTSNTDVMRATLQHNPEAKFAVLDRQALTPEGYKPQSRAYWPFGLIMGINYETSEMERAAVWMYLEWLSQPDNLFTLQNGIEGMNYVLDEEGIAINNPDYVGESALSLNNNKDYWSLVIELPEYPDSDQTRKAYLRNWAPSGYEYLAEDLLNIYDKNAEYRTPDVFFTIVLDTVNEHKADLDSLFRELFVKITLAPIDEFDTVYEAAKQNYLKAGYQKIIDEKMAAVLEGKFRR